MSKININETTDREEIEIPGAGQWGVPHDKAEAAFGLIEDRYKYLVDDTYLSGFLAGFYFFIVPEDSETHGMDIEEYFENSLLGYNMVKNSPKMPGIGMLSAILG